MYIIDEDYDKAMKLLYSTQIWYQNHVQRLLNMPFSQKPRKLFNAIKGLEIYARIRSVIEAEHSIDAAVLTEIEDRIKTYGLLDYEYTSGLLNTSLFLLKSCYQLKIGHENEASELWKNAREYVRREQEDWFNLTISRPRIILKQLSDIVLLKDINELIA